MRYIYIYTYTTIRHRWLSKLEYESYIVLCVFLATGRRPVSSVDGRAGVHTGSHAARPAHARRTHTHTAPTKIRGGLPPQPDTGPPAPSASPTLRFSARPPPRRHGGPAPPRAPPAAMPARRPPRGRAPPAPQPPVTPGRGARPGPGRGPSLVDRAPRRPAVGGSRVRAVRCGGAVPRRGCGLTEREASPPGGLHAMAPAARIRAVFLGALTLHQQQSAL